MSGYQKQIPQDEKRCIDGKGPERIAKALKNIYDFPINTL